MIHAIYLLKSSRVPSGVTFFLFRVCMLYSSRMMMMTLLLFALRARHLHPASRITFFCQRERERVGLGQLKRWIDRGGNDKLISQPFYPRLPQHQQKKHSSLSLLFKKKRSPPLKHTHTNTHTPHVHTHTKT
jgi:hypothetical protein